MTTYRSEADLQRAWNRWSEDQRKEYVELIAGSDATSPDERLWFACRAAWLLALDEQSLQFVNDCELVLSLSSNGDRWLIVPDSWSERDQGYWVRQTGNQLSLTDQRASMAYTVTEMELILDSGLRDLGNISMLKQILGGTIETIGPARERYEEMERRHRG